MKILMNFEFFSESLNFSIEDLKFQSSKTLYMCFFWVSPRERRKRRESKEVRERKSFRKNEKFFVLAFKYWEPNGAIWG